MAEDLNLIQKDMGLILQLSSKYDIRKKGMPGKVLELMRERKVLSSALGRIYLRRLNELENGEDQVSDKICLFCRAMPSKDGVLCQYCMNQYSNNLLGFASEMQANRPSVSKSSAADYFKDSAPLEKGPKASAKDAAPTADMAEPALDITEPALEPADLSLDMTEQPLEPADLSLDMTEQPLDTMEQPLDAADIFNEEPASSFEALFAPAADASGSSDTFGSSNASGSSDTSGSALPRREIDPLTRKGILVAAIIGVFVVLSIFTLIADESPIGSAVTGILEEIGKLAIVAYAVKRFVERRDLLKGMVLGAAVGGIFAAFESANYALRYFMIGTLTPGAENYDKMISVILNRTTLLPCGQIAWAVIAAGALILALRDENFSLSFVKRPVFCLLFAFSAAMHMLWDIPVLLFSADPFSMVHIGMVLISWIIVLVLLNIGLSRRNRE